MAEQTNQSAPTRGILTMHVEKLRAMALQLLQEVQRLSENIPEDTVGGWLAERAATASFGQKRCAMTGSADDRCRISHK